MAMQRPPLGKRFPSSATVPPRHEVEWLVGYEPAGLDLLAWIVVLGTHRPRLRFAPIASRALFLRFFLHRSFNPPKTDFGALWVPIWDQSDAKSGPK